MLNVRTLYNCIKSDKWKVACLTIVVVGAWLVWYYWLAVYVVYAVEEKPNNESAWISVYRSMYFDKAMEKYMYLNHNKEDGVKHYIFVNQEDGNSIIPF